MKNITQYIAEKNLFSTPDSIYLNKRDKISYDNHGHTFIVNKDVPEHVIWGNNARYGCCTHYDMVDNIMNSDDKDKLLKYYGINPEYNGRFEKYGSEDDITIDNNWNKYKLKNEQYPAAFGRLWCLLDVLNIEYNTWKDDNLLYSDPLAIKKDFKLTKYPVIISFWDQLSKNEFNSVLPGLIKSAFDEKIISNNFTIDDLDILVTDNNGHLKLFNISEGWNKVKERTLTSKKSLEFARSIHTLPAQEKHKYFKLFRKNRDEKNQKEIYNHTKSKTEAEYRSIKYQESLEEMKTITQYITEKANFLIKKHQPAKPQHKYFPKTRGELEKIIKERIEKEGNKCDLNDVDVSKVTDMSDLFRDSVFSGDISKWDVSNVTDMHSMFWFSNFNGYISQWDVSNVTNMKWMFCNSKFNGDISQWDVSNVTDMQYMFQSTEFNMDISNWDVSNVTSMSCMFLSCPIKEEYKPKFKK